MKRNKARHHFDYRYCIGTRRLSWLATLTFLCMIAAGCGGGGTTSDGGSGTTSNNGGTTSGNGITGGTLRGMYIGYQGGFDILGGNTFVVEQRGLTFFPDGQFSTGTPIEGPEGFDIANAFFKGTYQISGNQINLNYEDGSHTSANIASNGNFKVYDVEYQSVPRMDGVKLQGSYGRIWGDAWYGEMDTIQFRTDGTFQDNGVLPDTALSVAAKYLHGAQLTWSYTNRLRGDGIYRIQNNTLFLDYNTGHQETIQVYTSPDYVQRNPIPAIILGGYVFERKGD